MTYDSVTPRDGQINRLPSARWVVIEVATLARNVMTEARSLQQVNIRIMQCEPPAVVPGLNPSEPPITGLIGQAQTVLENVQTLQCRFLRYYPALVSPSAPCTQFFATAQTRWLYALLAFLDTLEAQSKIIRDHVRRAVAGLGPRPPESLEIVLLMMHAVRRVQDDVLQFQPFRTGAHSGQSLSGN